MAIMFKIVFAMLAVCAVTFAFPSEATKNEAKQELTNSASVTGDLVHKTLQAAKNKVHEELAVKTISTTEETHSRHKRGLGLALAAGKLFSKTLNKKTDRIEKAQG